MIDFLSSYEVLIQLTLSMTLLAISLQIPLRMGVISFASVGYFAIGGYATAILVAQQGINAWAAVFLSTILGGVIAYILGLGIAHLNGLYLAMATVSFSLILSVVAVNGGSLTGGPVGLFGVIGPITTWHFLVVVAVVIFLVSFTERGKLSRRFDAIREDPQLAAAMGINVVRYRRLSFLISGAIGALSGSMATLMKSAISPESIGFGLIILALTVIIVGGQGSWVGAVLGSLFFLWMPQTIKFVGTWEPVLYGFIVAVAAVTLPGGVLAVYRNWRYRRTAAKVIAQQEARTRDLAMSGATGGGSGDGV